MEILDRSDRGHLLRRAPLLRGRNLRDAFTSEGKQNGTE